VKQGSVLSPTLFSIYLDVLLDRLNGHRAGCRIGNQFCGALAYADDLTLISPSVKGLQSLIDVCYLFGSEYDLVFNECKTVCMKFGYNSVNHADVYMGNTKLTWATKVKHLGNLLNSNLTDSDDIRYKKSCFYGSVNKTLALFGTLPSELVESLFHTYCTSFFGSQLWNLNNNSLQELYIAWQKSVRRIWCISPRTHVRYLSCLSSSGLHISDQLMLRFCKLYLSMLTSNNVIVSSLARRSVHSVNSTLGENLGFLYCEYGINICKHSYRFVRNFILDNVKNHNCTIVTSQAIRDLCNARDKVCHIENLERDNIISLIDCLCTD
jgi:hypothetical protein